MDDGDNWQARVEQISGDVAAQAVHQNNKTLPQQVQRINQNHRKRYS
ncbi:hypothetical protein [Paracoccus beibuensis]|nr:hypothetical protein [Paracoccus beibuensis]